MAASLLPAAALALLVAAAAASPAASSSGASSSASLSSLPSVAAACAADDDTCCELNGVFDAAAGACDCFAPWSGPACATLALLPARNPQGYGMAPNLTSWGAAVWADADDPALHHMVVAESTMECPLYNWQTNLRCSHAVSRAGAGGVFEFESVAVAAPCANPAVVPFLNATTGQRAYALFHIGSGTGGTPVNCSRGSGSGNSRNSRSSRAAAADAGADATGSTLHIAPSPFGPWQPSPYPPPSCNNPAPLLLANSSWLLLCDSTALYAAGSVLGPWSRVGTLDHAGGLDATYEDATLFVDARGHFHALFHAYNVDKTDSCVGSIVSAHAYSRDGLAWMGSPVQPFTNEVLFEDGSSSESQALRVRECASARTRKRTRPHLHTHAPSRAHARARSPARSRARARMRAHALCRPCVLAFTAPAFCALQCSWQRANDHSSSGTRRTSHRRIS